MKFLSVGGGAREHAIVRALVEGDAEVYAAMGNRNPGIARLAKDVLYVKESEVPRIVEWAAAKGCESAVIGPEAPLAVGLTDALQKHGIKVAGPSQKAAMIETSKEFARNLMNAHEIPGRVLSQGFEDLDALQAFLRDYSGDVVVKPVGLTGGKGVRIMGEHLHSHEDVVQYAKEIIQTQIGGSPRFLIEERLEGEEFTLQCLVDGKKAIPMPAVQDHKRAYEMDRGPNTGGMGSYSQEDHLLPFLTRDGYEQGREIVQRTVDALRQDGVEFRGFLYGQFMLTSKGVKVVEFNARLGDPEAMNVLPLLETNFADLCAGIAEGALPSGVRFAKKATVCKYVVPKGYGIKSVVGAEIKIDEKKIGRAGAELFYASVNEEDGRILTTKSRALAVLGIRGKIAEAEKVCERALRHIRGEVYVRHDIGTQTLIERKMARMKGILRDKA
ncbi:MAG: phosphoribosylamine--glycine ligase [Candidatus Thermoplasmatota archaeon]